MVRFPSEGLQPLLENRQDNQSHSGVRSQAFHGNAQLRVTEPARCHTSADGRLSRITTTEDNGPL